MDDLTLHYYESELRYLREAGKEFARVYPERAALLNMENGEACDPTVERLFEGFAFLMGRLRQKLDDDFPELIEGVFSLLAPHYLRAVPSLTIVELGLQPYTLQQDKTVPAGFSLLTSTVGTDSERYQYRTTSPVVLHPLRLIQTTRTLCIDGSLLIRLEFQLEPQARREAVDLSRLRLFLHADQPIALMLQLALTNQPISVELCSAGRRIVNTSELYFEPVGFSPEQSLWPTPDTAFGGHMLLLEYFVFREKFLFVDLCGLDVSLIPIENDIFEIEIGLGGRYPPDAIPVTPTLFGLYCVPAVNLFELDAEPIRVNHQVTEYRIVPRQPYGSCAEVFSVNDVRAFDPTTGKSHPYLPFCSFRHRKGVLRQDAPEHYFHTRIRQAPSGLYETWLILAGDSRWPTLKSEEILSLQVTASNGMMSLKKLRDSKLSVVVKAIPGVASVRNVTALTLPCYPPVASLLYWQVLAHLATNYLVLLDADVLRNTLAMYDWTHDELNKRRIAGISQLSYQPLHRIERGCVRRGVEITVMLDSANFSGDGDLALFGTLLHHFFARYANLNLFTKLVVIAMPTGQRWEWKANKSISPI